MGREQTLALAFNKLADILVCKFNVEEYLNALTTNCVRVLDVDAAGVLLTVDQTRLEVVCASTEAARLLGVLQVTANEGPCVETARTGQTINASDLRSEQQWNKFTPAALNAGFAAAHAIPLQLRGQMIGALNFFRRRAGPLSREDQALGQALAEAATAGLLSKRALEHAEALANQLQRALTTRVVIEQAKGLLAARRESTLDDAFEVMRSFARNDRRMLSEIAMAVVNGSPTVTALNKSH
jgi:GAF domain-containing protein